MILSQIQSRVYDRLGLTSSPESGVVTRLLGHINDVHKEILADPVFARLRRKTLAFATVASQPTTVLPQAAVRLYNVVDRTNQYELDELKTISEVRGLDPGYVVTTSTPQAFVINGYSEPVARQPADASQLLVKSTAAGDTTQTAYIEYIDSDGVIKQASVVLTGTTAVNIASTATLVVLDLYLSAACTGTVTLNEDTGAGTELARIGIGATRARYTQLEIYPKPSAAVTLYADVDVFIKDLVNASDEPLIPDEYCESIVYGVKAREWERREKPNLMKADLARSKQILAPLIHQMHRLSGRPSPPTGEIRHSQLGAYYPPGS